MISIYVTDLSAYNEGHLVGKWIQLSIGETELYKGIAEVLKEGEMLSESRCHEEIFISDYEADIHVREYDNIDELNELAEVLENYGEDELLKLKLLSSEGYSEREVIKRGIDSYDVEIHDFRDRSSFSDTFELPAESFVDEGLYGEILTALNFYIDYEAIGLDSRMD